MKWTVYIIETSENSFYTGITTDINRRFNEHCNGKGAKFFNTCQPLRVAYQETGHSRSSASKREAEIKKLAKHEKVSLIQNQN